FCQKTVTLFIDPVKNIYCFFNVTILTQPNFINKTIMKSLYYFFILIFITGFISCRDDFHFEPSSGTELAFSKDTVYLDTIFSNIGSSTYNLKVYNKSNKDIKIPSVRLNKGENSNFRLMVDGLTGKSFENIELLANDSLFIFVETTVDIKQQ